MRHHACATDDYVPFPILHQSGPLSRFFPADVGRPAHAPRRAGRVVPVAVDRVGAAMVVSPAPAAAPPAIELQRVWLGWRDRIAVRDASGVFSRGSLTAVVGPNGAGKSTLIKAMAGRLSPARGRIRIDPEIAGDLACLPQSAELDLDFPVSTF